MPPKSPPKNRKHRRRFRFLKLAGIAFFIAAAILWLVVRHIAPSMIVEPPRSDDKALTPADFKFRTFQTDDQIELTAWQNIPANQPIGIWGTSYDIPRRITTAVTIINLRHPRHRCTLRAVFRHRKMPDPYIRPLGPAA